MADVEASTADIVTLDDGGHFVVVTDAGAAEAKRLAVADVAAGVALAETAIQTADLGTAAFAAAEDFAPMSVIADIETALDAILAGGD
jgi:hypothetical protein